jgi:hypothetical protein
VSLAKKPLKIVDGMREKLEGYRIELAKNRKALGQ